MVMEPAAMARTRLFDTGPASFLVATNDPAAVAAVEAMFGDLPVPALASPRGSSAVEIVLTARDDGSWSVAVGDQVPMSNLGHSAALAAVVTGVTRLALDAEPDALHLHAAGLARAGRGILVSAASGVGKSTLTTWLASQGWTYLSDEAVALRQGTSAAVGFNKPILLKQGADALSSELGFGELDGASAGVDTESWMCVPVGSLPEGALTQTVEPELVAVLARRADANLDTEATLTPLHPTDAVVALLGQTMDPERFGPDTLGVLADLAARCTCATLWVGPPPSMESALATGLDGGPDTHELEELVADGRNVPAEVRSFRIGDRVVAHQTSEGAVVALDEAGSAVWLALHGCAPAWFPAENMEAPTTQAFLTQLRDLDLVTPSG